eukprot:XP_006516144.3 PREDICTED: histone-lysine N-methyltransferase setd3 isoform X4 [Mus musculus]
MADQHPGWRADGRRGGAAPRRVRCGPMNGGGGPWAGPRGGRSRVGPRRRGCLWLPSSPSRPAAAATAAAAAWGLVEADGGVPAGVWRRRCAKTKRAVRKWNVAVLHPAQGKNGKSTRRSGLWLRKYGRSKKAEELFLWVPRKLLMTVESAKNSVLGPLYSQDRILQAMGNIALAFHLLCERASPNSFWQPYIQTLPSEYDTPLYFEEEEVRCLQSTQAIHDVFSQYKNTARQYAYFYKVIQITTGYNLEDDRCECVALQDFQAGDQIYIFYGTRSNAEFVIHSGFFFDNNSHDRVKIKLGVSKSDRLYAMKAEVLARAGIPTSSVFALHSTEPPISAQLLAFLRVFCMTEEELKEHLLGDSAIDRIFTLGNAEFPVSWDNEVKLWTFLEDRASLLLKTYKTTIEEDKIVLKNPDLSVRATMAIKLRLGEKEILEKAVKSAAVNREYYRKHMEERAPLPRYEESDLGLLEGGVGDSRLPLVLRKLEEEAGVQESLSLTETVSKVKAAENGLVNGENLIPNGTRSENESLSPEESENVTGEESSGSMAKVKERL